MNCFTRLFAIVRKEVRQLRRDRLSFGMIVGIPIMQIILFGYAINTDIRHLSAAVGLRSVRYETAGAIRNSRLTPWLVAMIG